MVVMIVHIIQILIRWHYLTLFLVDVIIAYRLMYLRFPT